MLVDAEDETQPRRRGEPMLYDLYEDMRRRLGRDVPIDSRTVRPATNDEIDLRNWHHEITAHERR